jgi:hypothetical protein
MAAEWFPVDVSLDTKPEVQELVDMTGEPVEVIVFRLLKLWGWVQLNTADGRFRSTPSRLGRICGGDAPFWEAVAVVGWIVFDGETAQIPKWEERFGGAAKRRALKNSRQSKWRRSGGADVDAHEAQVRLHERLACASTEQDITGQDRTEEEIQPAAPVATSVPKRKRSQPADAVSWSADAGWQGITDADRQEWRLAYPACDLTAELAKAGSWLKANPTRAHKSNWRRFVVSWLTRSQDKGGTNRTPGVRPDERAPPQPQANRRFFRSDAQRSMTDAEHAAWRRDQRQGGTVAALAGSIRLTEEVTQ